MTVVEVARDLLHHPLRHVLGRWHWKSATLSAAIRGGVFFATNISTGLGGAMRATLVEFVLIVPLVGLLAAVTQAFRCATPKWAATLLLTTLLPGLAQAAELFVHWTAGTPALRASVSASVGLSILSTAFNLFAMRHDVLIVGPGGARALGDDLRQLPRLLLAFTVAPARLCAEWMGKSCR